MASAGDAEIDVVLAIDGPLAPGDLGRHVGHEGLAASASAAAALLGAVDTAAVRAGLDR